MTKQYAILHIEKGKGSGGGLGNHIDRTKGKEHTYPHSDPERKHLNVEFVQEKYKELTVPQAIKLRIEKGYKKKTAIRKDAVKYLSTILTGSAEQMQKIYKDKELMNKWIAENFNFAADEFGEENIVRFTLHLDEKTPHIHVVHVPITNEGGISARQYIGNRTKLKEMQDRYAVSMKKFGLERGEIGRGIKHENAKDYYKRIEITSDKVDNLISKGLLGINKNQTIENLQNALKTALMDLNDKREKERNKLKDYNLKLKISKNQTQNLKDDLVKSSKKLNQSLKERSKNIDLINSFLKDPKALEIFKNNLIEKRKQFEAEKKRKKGRNRGRSFGI